jgi:hypothetical protein
MGYSQVVIFYKTDEERSKIINAIDLYEENYVKIKERRKEFNRIKHYLNNYKGEYSKFIEDVKNEDFDLSVCNLGNSYNDFSFNTEYRIEYDEYCFIDEYKDVIYNGKKAIYIFFETTRIGDFYYHMERHLGKEIEIHCDPDFGYIEIINIAVYENKYKHLHVYNDDVDDYY